MANRKKSNGSSIKSIAKKATSRKIASKKSNGYSIKAKSKKKS